MTRHNEPVPSSTDDNRTPVSTSFVPHGLAPSRGVSALAPDSPERRAVAELLSVLDLEDDPDGQPDTFLGRNQPQPTGRVYGGQVLGQSLVAAQRTIDEDRPVHSLHAYFLRAGDSGKPITFSVERLRDGRSFSARRVHALQSGRPILSMIASFQSPVEGLDHQTPMPEIPDPESLPSLVERYARYDSPMVRSWASKRPIDLRHVESPLFLESTEERADRQSVWMRTVDLIPDDPRLHAAVLVYASDYTLLEPVLRRHGHSFASPGLKIASLDHAMWWHRPVRADEWLLYTQESPSATGARGLGIGRIFSQDGRLACTVAQEGMIRVP
jgi:acyl-CoA thioesterase II